MVVRDVSYVRDLVWRAPSEAVTREAQNGFSPSGGSRLVIEAGGRARGEEPKVTREQKRIAFSIRGIRPVPWGSGGEWAWRSALATRAKAEREKNAPLGFHLFSDFTVRVDFYLSDPAYQRSDVDNLVKPVLDTLFKEIRKQAPIDDVTGALFDAYDSQVKHLTISKSRVHVGEEGVDIEVEWPYQDKLWDLSTGLEPENTV